MIITGGEARGRRIASPEGLAVRPTASKIRQAFFNILGRRLAGGHFLDVFAGSGLMGLEALSRGAADLVAIEESGKLVTAIESSLKMLGSEAEIIRGDFRRVLPTLSRWTFDVAYADPPYKSPFAATVLRIIDDNCVIKKDGILAIEHAKGFKFPDDLKALRFTECRLYGQTGISFFEPILETEAVKL